MSLDPRAVHIHVDGSCLKNPGGASGCAAIVCYPDHLGLPAEQIVDYGCSESTNQRMELMACIKALEWVREHRPWPDVTRVQIITDSTYVTNGIASAPYWRKKDWRSLDGRPISNSKLWKELLANRAKAGISVDFEHQLGKKTPEGKLIDAAAKLAAKRAGFETDRGYPPGTVRRSMVKERGAAPAYPAKGQVAIIRPYAKKPILHAEERVSFNLFNETTQVYESKFYAYATATISFDLHSWRNWRVQFNDDAKYPQIISIICEVPIV